MKRSSLEEIKRGMRLRKDYLDTFTSWFQDMTPEEMKADYGTNGFTRQEMSDNCRVIQAQWQAAWDDLMRITVEDGE